MSGTIPTAFDLGRAFDESLANNPNFLSGRTSYPKQLSQEEIDARQSIVLDPSLEDVQSLFQTADDQEGRNLTSQIIRAATAVTRQQQQQYDQHHDQGLLSVPFDIDPPKPELVSSGLKPRSLANPRGVRINRYAPGGDKVKPYGCAHLGCEEIAYSTSAELTKHMRLAHNCNRDPGVPSRPFRCTLPNCGKAWKQVGGLQTHCTTTVTEEGHVDGDSIGATREDEFVKDLRRARYYCPHPYCMKGKAYKQIAGLRYHLTHGHFPIASDEQIKAWDFDLWLRLNKRKAEKAFRQANSTVLVDSDDEKQESAGDIINSDDDAEAERTVQAMQQALSTTTTDIGAEPIASTSAIPAEPIDEVQQAVLEPANVDVPSQSSWDEDPQRLNQEILKHLSGPMAAHFVRLTEGALAGLGQQEDIRVSQPDPIAPGTFASAGAPIPDSVNQFALEAAAEARAKRRAKAEMNKPKEPRVLPQTPTYGFPS
ncbi:uncharacterized protein L969DRAFT_86528 [Mixia osmundae IAM 14324]|uniref:C2H2-type domain-containing protein n=1 Tax=Mixia osmundae (strain CBS 9802 / IAM 14324 / JCM 22182 / KY 12970) TaxID=764103 RepID=G7E9H8_MIXOS|nr:uncharacterized protein L969DRAFT_86528 [Mixia osmundae IAM 14324]KEI39929.1 hypothetical protein L969DRAFT_86528 [Mixia osmundae IAM 14324]GAA99297.1 hypothetical protein E5Q_05992 [Mixia osmundae IAM 14324]